MLEALEKAVKDNPKKKASELASMIQAEKTEVNSVLYAHPDKFIRDESYRWVINEEKFEIRLSPGWVDRESFENSLAASGSPLDSSCNKVVIVFPGRCRVMVDAIARLLALCNQLIFDGRELALDFTECKKTASYFNRFGFFDHLNSKVRVIPKRPAKSTAAVFQGNNDGVVELGVIDSQDLDESIPKRLKNSFVTCAGESYSQAAFTFISELFGNVRDHSKSPIPGFAGLQFYKSQIPKIQTVISDSGVGIAKTARRVLDEKHPAWKSQFDIARADADFQLITEIFLKGGISQTGEDGRGLGLKRSGDVAATYNATVSIRQENFEVVLQFKSGSPPKKTFITGRPKIYGTHICFEFLLDEQSKSA